RDRLGSGFSLRGFHDRLLSFGTVPYSTIRDEWFGDASWLKASLAPMAPKEF
ncbi:MAG: hypothetical protein JO030_02200, partial [Candidatus Eremiobacteraeota bacterium]|nr:hypothetical protein [Candidatus Eremiobacteraeota bacterium]